MKSKRAKKLSAKEGEGEEAARPPKARHTVQNVASTIALVQRGQQPQRARRRRHPAHEQVQASARGGGRCSHGRGRRAPRCRCVGRTRAVALEGLPARGREARAHRHRVDGRDVTRRVGWPDPVPGGSARKAPSSRPATHVPRRCACSELGQVLGAHEVVEGPRASGSGSCNTREEAEVRIGRARRRRRDRRRGRAAVAMARGRWPARRRRRRDEKEEEPGARKNPLIRDPDGVARPLSSGWAHYYPAQRVSTRAEQGDQHSWALLAADALSTGQCDLIASISAPSHSSLPSYHPGREALPWLACPRAIAHYAQALLSPVVRGRALGLVRSFCASATQFIYRPGNGHERIRTLCLVPVRNARLASLSRGATTAARGVRCPLLVSAARAAFE